MVLSPDDCVAHLPAGRQVAENAHYIWSMLCFSAPSHLVLERNSSFFESP